MHIRCSGSRLESGAAPQLYRGTRVHYATAKAGRRTQEGTPSQETGRVILRTAFRGEGGCVAISASNAPFLHARKGVFFLSLPRRFRIRISARGSMSAPRGWNYAAIRFGWSMGGAHNCLVGDSVGFARRSPTIVESGFGKWTFAQT